MIDYEKESNYELDKGSPFIMGEIFKNNIDNEENKDTKEILEWNNEINLAIKFTATATQNAEKISRTCNGNRNYNILTEIIKGEYDFHLQNATKENDREYKIGLILASDSKNKNNLELIKILNGKIVCFEGLNYNRDFLITNIRILPFFVGTKSSKSIFAKIMFFTEANIRYSGMPELIVNRIISLPNAQLLRKKVDKNIKDWDNYLEIIEKQALDSEVFLKYSGYRIEPSLVHCTFDFNFFSKEEINKLKRFRSERIKLISYNETILNEALNDENEEDTIDDLIDNTTIEFNDIIGSIDRINYNNFSIKVELDPDFQEMVQEKKLVFPQKGYFRISKLGDLSQVRKLRKGLKNLKNGKGINQDLDCLLFDSNNYSKVNKNTLELSDKDLLLDTLNTNQKKAVEGVLNSEELFLIQGPPGTGKTTVIAEICYQNAIRGKRTLISSQSNLAVDNALSRLVHNPKVRIIREGNVSKVEKEGEKYTRENVVDTWLEKTAIHCEENLKPKKDFMITLNELLKEIEKIDLVKDKIVEFSNEIKKNKNGIEENRIFLEEIEKYQQELNCILEQVMTGIACEKKSLGTIDDIYYTKLSNLSNQYSSFYKDSKIKCILDEINNCEKYLLENNKLNYKKNQIARKIEQLNEIKSYLEYNQLEMIKLSINLDDNIRRLVLFIKEMVEKLKNLKELKNNLLGDREKIEYTTQLIQKLKNDFRLKESPIEEVEPINLKEGYDKILKDVMQETRYLDSNRPNRILLFFGFRKKWINNLFINLKKLNVIDSNIVGKMIYTEEKIQENQEIIANIKNKLNCILEETLEEETNSKTFLEESIYKTTSNIDNSLYFIKIEYSELKNNIVNKTSELNVFMSFITDLLAKNIESLKVENEKFISLHKKFNSILSLNLDLNASFENHDIKSYYKKYFEPIYKKTEIQINLTDEWINRIRNKKYGNKEELLKDYLDSINVVGITCVQSDSRNFNSIYSNFDVVIVDEVSKATPPELVLPLLKAKKIVLVGDHKQLPPMIGDLTFGELKAKIENKELDDESDVEDKNIEYMKRSIFEELYVNLDNENKVMLNIQYRMHSSIMDTINQFYKEKQESGLICGVKDEHISKNHKLSTNYFNEQHNLLWIDIPLSPKFYEEQVSTSYSNKHEVEAIEKILDDIYLECKEKGMYKEVALITFYGAQAKLLNKLVKK